MGVLTLGYMHAHSIESTIISCFARAAVSLAFNSRRFHRGRRVGDARARGRARDRERAARCAERKPPSRPLARRRLRACAWRARPHRLWYRPWRARQCRPTQPLPTAVAAAAASSRALASGASMMAARAACRVRLRAAPRRGPLPSPPRLAAYDQDKRLATTTLYSITRATRFYETSRLTSALSSATASSSRL